MKILHTCLNVSDLERSIKFYSDRLELKFVSRREIKQNNAEIAFLKDDSGAAIELTHWRDKETLTEGDNLDHIAFEVEDVVATVNELKSHGVVVAMEPFSLHGCRQRSLLSSTLAATGWNSSNWRNNRP